MSNRISKEIIAEIRELRSKGWSLPELKTKYQIGYGTVYRYIKDVKINPVYLSQWRGKRGGSIKRKLLAEENAFQKAKKITGSLTEKEKLIFLTALYWGEGSKGDFGLSNTDPELIKVFIIGLENFFGIKKNKMRVSIRIFEDLDKEECLKFWSKITGIPASKFVGVNVLSGKKTGKLKHGMCRIRVSKGGDLLKYMLALKRAVIEDFVKSP